MDIHRLISSEGDFEDDAEPIGASVSSPFGCCTYPPKFIKERLISV